MSRLTRSAIVLFLLLVCRYATGAETITGLFNLDTLPDTLTFSEDKSGVAIIEINLATTDGKKERIVRKYHISESHIWISSNKIGEFTILDSGDIAGAIRYFRTYSYNRQLRDWFLTKDIYFAAGRSGYGYEPPAIDISYSDGVEDLGGEKIDKSRAETEGPEARRARLSKELATLYASLTGLYKTRKLATMPVSAYDGLTLAEMIYNIPVIDQTAETYNNIGFFLGENEKSRFAALYVLGKVINAVPDRTSAYLNIADVYFEIGNLHHAKTNYVAYLEQMKTQGKTKKIPQRALDRAKMGTVD